MDQIDEFESGIQQEVEDTIDFILGDDLLDSQREDLANSITFLIDKYSKRLCRYLNTQSYGGNNVLMPYCYPNLNNLNTFNNCCVFPPGQNPFVPQAFNNYQQNLFQPMSSTTIAPNPYQMQMFQQQQFFPFNQPLMPSPEHITRKKNKKKARSKPKSKKNDKAQNPTKSKPESQKSESSTSPKPVKTKEIKTTSKSIAKTEITKDDQNPVKSDSTQKSTEEDKIKTFSWNPTLPTSGIIKYLSDKGTKGYPQLDEINITCNCHMVGSCSVRSLFMTREEFVASNRPTFFFGFTFTHYEVKLTHYKITKGQIGSQISNWIFEISDNSNNWKEIDRQSNFSFERNEAVFSVNQSNNEFAHHFRLRHDGPTSNSELKLSIGFMELYGTMREHTLVDQKAGFATRIGRGRAVGEGFSLSRHGTIGFSRGTLLGSRGNSGFGSSGGGASLSGFGRRLDGSGFGSSGRGASLSGFGRRGGSGFGSRRGAAFSSIRPGNFKVRRSNYSSDESGNISDDFI